MPRYWSYENFEFLMTPFSHSGGIWASQGGPLKSSETRPKNCRFEKKFPLGRRWKSTTGLRKIFEKKNFETFFWKICSTKNAWNCLKRAQKIEVFFYRRKIFSKICRPKMLKIVWNVPNKIFDSKKISVGRR